MFGLRVALVCFVAACINSQAVPCDDGRTCPAGTVCKTLTDPDQPMCVTPEQIDACKGHDELAECGLDGAALARCYQGVCLAAGCGNLRIDPDEACDDGNSVVGDGCSSGCTSNETCGNGIVDPVVIVGGVLQPNEQCDDANLISRDGCASSCAIETPVWEQLVIGKPSPRHSAALAYDSVRRRVVLFGGGIGNPTLSQTRGDTWEWDGVAWISVPTPFAPAARMGHVMTYDASRRRIVLFGGQSAGDSDSTLSDTWELDGTRWASLAPLHAPSPRTQAAAAYDSARKRTVMFGGVSAGTFFDETWVFEGDDWTRLDLTPHPSARAGHTMVLDPSRGVIVMAGGQMSALQDTWEFDGTSWRDVTPPDPANRIGQATGFRLAYDGVMRRVIARAGFDTWAWNGTAWTRIVTGTSGTTSPAAPAAYSLATDPINGTVVDFGGLLFRICPPACYTTYDETWLWNGTAWTAATVNNPALSSPPLRHAFASAYDSTRGRLVVFGGITDSFTRLGDTWELADGHWTPYTTSVPAPRDSAAMAFDSKRGVSVLFGGDGDLVSFAETWTWNGSQWMQLTPAMSPSSRTDAAMEFDPVRGHIMLFGGNESGIPQDDTWEWDGTNWSKLTPATKPGARAHAAVAWDPIRRRIVMSGGNNNVTAFRDAWEWDGTNWSEITTPSRPPSRSDAALAWLAPRARLALFGGRSGTQGADLSDTWELGNDWTQVTAESVLVGRREHACATTPDGSGLLVFGGLAANGGFGASTSEVWRLRWRSPDHYELCAIDEDADGDGLAGCSDPDCWAMCSPLCPPGATCESSWPRCGDGTCDPRETCRLCPLDCTCTAICGDTFCDPPETSASCPGDCL